MARQIPQVVKTLLESGEGIESIMLIGVVWKNGQESFYADKDIDGTQGRIISFGDLETISRLDNSGSSTQLSFTLNDYDGVIKTYLDTTDITMCQVKVYQLFNEIAIGERVLMFEGYIATPIEWDEGTRNVELTAITKQVTKDVGFCLDDSAVTIFHQDLIGKAWPMVFGSPNFTPTLLLNEIPSGTITLAFGVSNSDLEAGRLEDLQKEYEFVYATLIGIGIFVAEESGYNPITGLRYSTEQDFDQAQQAAIAWAQSQTSKLEGIVAEMNSEREQAEQSTLKFRPKNFVVGGYRFPQNIPLICKINERVFRVTFLGEGLPNNPDDPCPVQVSLHNIPLKYIKGESVDDGGSFFQAGSRIELVSDLPGGYHYVASITPGILEGIYAYRTFNGVKRLTKVPERYYSIREELLESGLVVTYVVLKYPLSAITYRDNARIVQRDDYLARIDNKYTQPNPSYLNNEVDWENEIFVNFQSSVGPYAINVMIWLIDNYTPYKWDFATFQAAAEETDDYTVDFCLTDLKPVNDLLQDIAYQSRCAIWLKNGRYYVKYLPKQYDATSIITENDIIAKSFRVSCTSTDEVITKINAKWKPDYVQPERTAIVRLNVDKYGVIEEEQTYYIYKQYGAVLKSAIFWLIRRSNVWKKVACDLLLSKLDIETLDDVTLSLGQPLVANGDIDCQVESATYNSGENTISVELWMPVRLGEMEPLSWAYPGSIDVNQLIPPYNPITVSAGPTLKDKPTIPAYNGMSNNAAANIDTQDFAPGKHFQGWGFVAKKTETPKKVDDVTVMKFLTAYNPYPIAPSNPTYNYQLQPAPLPKTNRPYTTEQPIATGETKQPGLACPAKVISGTGTVWLLDAYFKGLSAEPISVQATEVHGSVNLKGIENTWVICFKNISKDGQTTYEFCAENNATYPVRMLTNATAAVFAKGSSGPSFNTSIKQLQLSSEETIPPGTWGICTRIWDGNDYIYEIQIPIWLD